MMNVTFLFSMAVESSLGGDPRDLDDGEDRGLRGAGDHVPDRVGD